MKKIVYLILILCLNTQVLFGADAALIPDTIRLENVLESFAEPDFGIKVGKINMVQGKAILIHLGSTQAYWVKEEYPLFKGDTIITLKGGRIRLQLNDGSILTLASETRLVINQSVYDPDAKTRSSFMGMAVGKARFVVRKIQDALQSDFKIKTQTAVVGVRGSDFIVEADADATKVVTLDDTRLEIISLADPKMEQTVLNDYEKIVVGHDAMPYAVEAVSIEDAKRIIREMDIVPVSPEKLQINTEKFHHGSQKEVVHAIPEKIKEDIKALAVEKAEIRHEVATEKLKSGQIEKVEPKAFEAVKPDQFQRTEVKTEMQGIVKDTEVELPKSELPSRIEIQNDVNGISVIELPKAENSEKADFKIVDIQGQGVAKEKFVEFVSPYQIEKVEIKAIESPKLEALDIKVFEISKPDTIRAAVADVVRENKEVIQSNVAEIKVLSAQDVSGSLSQAAIAQGNIIINSSLGGTSSENSDKSASETTSQVVIASPIAEDKVVQFTPPSQLENPIKQTDITVLPSDATKPDATLPEATKPATETSDPGTFLPNIQTQLPAPTMSPTSPLISPGTLINRQ